MKITDHMSPHERLAESMRDAERYFALFNRGARIKPEHPLTRAAIEALRTAWPRAFEADRQADSFEVVGSLMQAVIAAAAIRAAVDTGGRIVEPETTTPGAPRG